MTAFLFVPLLIDWPALLCVMAHLRAYGGASRYSAALPPQNYLPRNHVKTYRTKRASEPERGLE